MKQRLVGAIVLGCLAVIFLPALLDGKGLTSPAMSIVIPIARRFPEPLKIEPQRPVVISDTDEILIKSEVYSVLDNSVEVIDAIAVNDNEDDQINIVELPMLDSEGLPQAWSVRLGLFGDKENAEALITELFIQSYRAYSNSISTSQGDLIAVFVGPVVTRTEAESLRVKLSNSFNIDAVIVEFGINEEN